MPNGATLYKSWGSLKITTVLNGAFVTEATPSEGYCQHSLRAVQYGHINALEWVGDNSPTTNTASQKNKTPDDAGVCPHAPVSGFVRVASIGV